MKLELKHLAPYLPYGLKSLGYYPNGGQNIQEVTTLNVLNLLDFDSRRQPILRPLSDLTEHKDGFIQLKVIRDMNLGHVDYITNERDHWISEYGIDGFINKMPHGIFQKLIEWHFDLFNLIPQGLAIDINTLEQ
jgi:hypothetical protein